MRLMGFTENPNTIISPLYDVSFSFFFSFVPFWFNFIWIREICTAWFTPKRTNTIHLNCAILSFISFPPWKVQIPIFSCLIHSFFSLWPFYLLFYVSDSWNWNGASRCEAQELVARKERPCWQHPQNSRAMVQVPFLCANLRFWSLLCRSKSKADSWEISK